MSTVPQFFIVMGVIVLAFLFFAQLLLREIFRRASNIKLNPVYCAGIFFLVILPVTLFALRDPAPALASPQFVSSVGRIQPGVEFFIHDTKAYVCTAKEISKFHLFDDGTTRPGVRVIFKDGVERWIPKDAVHKIYVVKYHSE